MAGCVGPESPAQAQALSDELPLATTMRRQNPLRSHLTDRPLSSAVAFRSRRDNGILLLAPPSWGCARFRGRFLLKPKSRPAEYAMRHEVT